MLPLSGLPTHWVLSSRTPPHHSTLASFHSPARRPANPAYTADELKYQLETTKAKLIITHPVCLQTASSVANVPIVVLDSPSGKLPYGAVSMDQLVSFGGSRAENYTPVHLEPGEAKKTLAFLSFSSGTTGKPKVSCGHDICNGQLTQCVE
jgi:acyl-coenzyme A synthetase/AMP-(fatty) acid ligase